MNPNADNTPSTTPAAHAVAPVARVNLLPEAVCLAQAGRRRLRRWAGVLVATGVLASMTWLWCSNHGSELDHVQSTLAEELARTQQQQKRAAALAARAEVQRKRRAVLETMRSSESWAARLAELAAAVPDGVVLKRIEVVPALVDRRPALPPTPARGERIVQTPNPASPPKVEVRIDGYAADHLVLATLLRRLEEGGAYRDVRLVRSATAEQAASGCLDFGLVCQR